jgi:hypothetical protein
MRTYREGKKRKMKSDKRGQGRLRSRKTRIGDKMKTGNGRGRRKKRRVKTTWGN